MPTNETQAGLERNAGLPPARSRRARAIWARPWSVALTAVVCVGIAIALFLAAHWPFTREKITQAIQGDFPGPVTIGSFRNTYFPHPGCVLETTTISGNSGHVERPLITARQLVIQGSYSSFLTGSRNVNIRAQGVRVFVPPDYQRPAVQNHQQTSIDTLHIGDLVFAVGRASGEALRFDVHYLDAGPLAEGRMMQFHASLTNALPRGEVKVDGRFGPWHSNTPSKSVLSGSYTLAQADMSVFPATSGMVSSTGTFNGVLANLQVDGAIRSPNFAITASGHPVALDGRFRVDVDDTNGDVTLREASVVWGGTTLLATGGIKGRAQQEGKTVDLDLTVQKGRIQDLMLLVMRSAPLMHGPVSFRGKAVLPPGEDEFMKRVQFNAAFGINGGQFTKPAVQQEVDKLSERARGEKDNDPERVLTALKGLVALRNGVADISNASLEVPAATALFAGKCNMLTRRLDLHGQLRMAATMSQATTGSTSILLKIVDPLFRKKKQHVGADVAVRMTGTFENPQVGMDLIPK